VDQHGAACMWFALVTEVQLFCLRSRGGEEGPLPRLVQGDHVVTCAQVMQTLLLWHTRLCRIALQKWTQA
jgi:hypothetical protein